MLLPLLAAGLTAGILLGRASDALYPVLPAALLMTGAFFVLPENRRSLAILATGCVLGFAAGYIAYHPSLPPAGTYRVTGVICDDVQQDPLTGRVRTRLTGVKLVDEEERQYTAGGAYWSFFPEELPEGLLPGRQIHGMLRVYVPSGQENPGGFDFREYLLSQGITLGVYGDTDLTVTEPAAFSAAGMAARLRYILTQRLIAVMGERAGGYAAAMLLGTKTLLASDELAAFSELGFSHILSVSGFHVGILAGLLLWILKKRSRVCRVTVLSIVLWVYILVTGGHAPVIRAAVLLMMTQLKPRRKGRISSQWTLLGAYVITLLINPAQLTSASFQLTYGAVAGLVIVSPRLTGLLQPKNRLVGWLWQGLCASAAAQLGLLLPQLYWFHQLPVLGLVLNPFVILLGGVLITAMWLVLLLCWVPVIGPAAGSVAAWAVNLFADGVVGLNGLGIFSLWTKQANLLTAAGWTALMTSLILLRERQGRTPDRARRRAVLCRILAAVGSGVILLSLLPVPHHGAEYLQFSVSSADAALLWDENTVTVIDTA